MFMAIKKPNFSFNYTTKVRDYLKKHESSITYVRDFVIIESIYGFLLAIMLHILLPSYFKFNIWYVIALGILFYFTKEELPIIIKKSRL